ncbi:MAG TPA: tetratricopeptide repeat protein [Kofleriaceae bacterium]|nr:tetratricopeptide repeat protein [Kofleriaceae bacterium]
MRRAIAALVVGILGPGLAATAAAGTFGGFARDGKSYLDGADRVCQPARAGAPVCRKASKDEVTKLGFRMGTPQRGSTATVIAEASGSTIKVKDARSKAVLVEWKALDPVSRIVAVHLAEGGAMVAVEYEARVSGRSVGQTVGLPLRGKDASTATPKPQTGTPQLPAPPPASATLTPAQAKAVAAAVKDGAGQLRKKKWTAAEAAYRKALGTAGDHPAARFGLAAALAQQKKTAEAVGELRLLARSAAADAPVWLVEARASAHFTALRQDPDFRRAVGIDRDPDRQPSAYERLVGPGGSWEQTGQSCQSPTVSLKLDRKTKKFVLLIRVRCQGDDETTRLGGTWAASGQSDLTLTFPNPGGSDEKLACKLTEVAGEDALGCTLEDIVMDLRIVRR